MTAMMTEAEARAYLSAHLAGLREPCPARKLLKDTCPRKLCPHESGWDECGDTPGSCTCPGCESCDAGCRCARVGTGEVARDWHLEDLLAAMEAAGWYAEYVIEHWYFTNRLTFCRASHRHPSIAAALALQQEEAHVESR